MSIDPNLLIAAKMIHDECVKYGKCDCCKIKFACAFSGIPSTWEIPDPPPEPTERQRIEWLRMLPDGEMLDAVIFVYDGRIDYNAGPIDWWHEVVTLEQFRKDVGMNY